MSRVASLLASLHRAGATLRQEGSRLIVEAPHGVITPEILGQLARSKHALLESLPVESPVSRDDAADAVQEISSLLAIAYRRYSAVGKVGTGPRKESGYRELANASESCVHGVVP